MIYIKTNTSSISEIFDLIKQPNSNSIENLFVEIECNSLILLPDTYASIAEVFFKQVQLLIGIRCEMYLDSYVKSLNIGRFSLSQYRNNICHNLAAIADKINSRTALLTFPCEPPHFASTNLIHFLHSKGNLNLNVYSRSIYLDYLAKDICTFHFLGQLVGYMANTDCSCLHLFIGSFNNNSASAVPELRPIDKRILFKGDFAELVEKAEGALTAIIEEKPLFNTGDYFSNMATFILSKKL